MTVSIIQGKDAEFNLFVTDKNGHPIDLTDWSMIRMRLPKTTGYIEKFAPLTTAVNAVQTITWSAVPGTGGFKLKIGDQTTSLFSYTVLAAAIQTALRLFNDLSEVTVTGDFGTGFVTTFAGADGGRAQLPITVVSNTLGVTATVTQTVTGVPETGVSVLVAASGSLKVLLSEDDTTALKVGSGQDMDLSIRIGARDLNLPTISKQLTVTKNAFI